MTDSANGCWDVSKRVCSSCEGSYRDIQDGLCSGCRGETTYSPEQARAARDRALTWKSSETLRLEREAEEYLAKHATARKAWRAGRPV